MDWDSLKDIFTDSAAAEKLAGIDWNPIIQWAQNAVEIGTNLAVEEAWKLLVLFVFLESYSRVKERRLHKKALREGKLDGEKCSFEETMYVYEDLEKAYIQRIRPIDYQVSLPDMFDPSVSKQMMKYIKKAKEKCTLEKPIVFQHLKEVIPPNEYDQAIERIASDWRSYFYAVVQPGTSPQSATLNLGEAFEERIGIPLLVYEPHPYHDRYRIFWINPDLINEENMPPKEQVKIEQPYEANRWDTNMAIIQQLKNEPWLIDKFAIPVTTGQAMKNEVTNNVIQMSDYTTVHNNFDIKIYSANTKITPENCI